MSKLGRAINLGHKLVNLASLSTADDPLELPAALELLQLQSEGLALVHVIGQDLQSGAHQGDVRGASDAALKWIANHEIGVVGNVGSSRHPGCNGHRNHTELGTEIR